MAVLTEVKKKASGIMVALYIPADIAESIAVQGGEDPEDMHVTLAYIPGLGEDEEAMRAVCKAIFPVAERFAPVLGRVGGIGIFNASESSDGKDVYYATLNAPVLPALVADVLNTLDWAGIDVARKHGFVPHITLKYMEQGDKFELGKSSADFRMPFLTVASRTFRFDIPFTGTRISKESPTGGDVHVPSTEWGIRRKRKKAASPDQTNPAPGPAVATDQGTPTDGGWHHPPENNDDIEIGKKRAVAKASDEIDRLERAKDADLVTLPDDVKGTNCGNCMYAESKGKGLWCDNSEVDQAVNPRMCCALWDAPGTEREWEGSAREVEKSADEELAVDALMAMFGSRPSDVDLAAAAMVAESKAMVVPIGKMAPMKQIAYGVVLEPNSVDLQGDIMTAEEIEKTAHTYMEKSRAATKRHMKGMRAFPVESYIAPQDLHWTSGVNGPQTVKKGSWVLGMKVYDPEDWAKVLSGEYSAFSIGGNGVREDVVA